MQWRWQEGWSCGGLVVARLVDWQWIGGGKVKSVGGRVAVVVEWGSDEWQWRSSGSGGGGEGKGQ